MTTAGITTVAALVAWWKNNSFAPAALQVDQTYDKLKARCFLAVCYQKCYHDKEKNANS